MLLTKLVRSRSLDIGQVLFLCVLMDQEKVEVHKNAKKKKKEFGQYSAILTSHLVNNGFIIWPKDYTKEFRFCGNKAGDPEWAR